LGDGKSGTNFDTDDLATFIETARGADTVWLKTPAAVGTNGQGGCRKSVRCATLSHSSLRYFAFRNSHGRILFLFYSRFFRAKLQNKGAFTAPENVL